MPPLGAPLHKSWAGHLAFLCWMFTRCKASLSRDASNLLDTLVRECVPGVMEMVAQAGWAMQGT
eukprot:2634938-Amphidinium_carterae.1